MEAAMRKAGVWFLTVAGLVGLLTAFSFQGHGGGVSRLQPVGPTHVEPMVWRVGLPDTWLEWESRPNAHIAGYYFLSWSFGILVASGCALCWAVLLSRRTPPQGRAERGAAPDRGGR
jgi:hypothetical protein